MPDSDQIEKLEQEEVAAVLRSDWDAIDKLYAPSFTLSTDALIFTKAMLMAYVRSGVVGGVKTYERQVLRISVEGDIAITTSHESFVPTIGPDATNNVFRGVMSVWRKYDGTWKLLARHMGVIARYPINPDKK
jgi:ketosteroid isomerase-like protein